MKRRLLKIIVTTLSALAIILHIYVHLTQLDFESIMESRRLQIQSYCVDKGTVFENHIKGLIRHCENWSLQSNSVTRQANFNRTKNGEKFKWDNLSNFQTLCLDTLPLTRWPKCFRQTASASIQVEAVSKNRIKMGELRSCNNQGSREYESEPAGLSTYKYQSY